VSVGHGRDVGPSMRVRCATLFTTADGCRCSSDHALHAAILLTVFILQPAHYFRSLRKHASHRIRTNIAGTPHRRRQQNMPLAR